MKLALTALAALLVFSGDAAAADSLHFKVPDGWVDLSPGAPAANFAQAPPTMVATVNAQHFAQYAADLAHGDDGFFENMSVSLAPALPPITSASLDEMGKALASGASSNGARFTIVEQEITAVGGIPVGRFVADAQTGAVQMRQLFYLVPGDRETGVVTYSATPRSFATYLPTFEAAVRETKGMREPRSGIHWGEVAMSGAVGGIVALVGTLLARRKKKKDADAAARAS